MIRVLQVPHSMNRGGIETMLMNYYRHIDRTKIQFDFLITDFEKCDYEDEILSLGGKIYRINHIRNGVFKYLKDLDIFFQSHANEYSIVHSHTSSRSFFPLLFSKKYGIKTRISHSHNSIGSKNLDGLIRNILKIPLKFVVTDRYACSEKAAEWLYGKNAMNKYDITLLRNAIDAKKFDYDKNIRKKIREELNLNDKVVYCHVGRFLKQKNHSFLIDIFEKICDKEENAMLLLAGTGELLEDTKIKVNKLGLEKKVLFLGVRTDIENILQGVDCFLLPSLYEGLPVVGIEAQASDTPCVMSNTITTETDITGLVKYFDLNKTAEEWANVIIEFRKLHPKKSMYNTIKKSGYDIVSNAKLLSKNYEKFFER